MLYSHFENGMESIILLKLGCKGCLPLAIISPRHLCQSLPPSAFLSRPLHLSRPIQPQSTSSHQSPSSPQSFSSPQSSYSTSVHLFTSVNLFPSVALSTSVVLFTFSAFSLSRPLPPVIPRCNRSPSLSRYLHLSRFPRLSHPFYCG